jgi:predicted dehydrogenase
MSESTSPKMTRRTFAKAGVAAVGLVALSASRALGANDRVRVAFVGVANRGGQLLEAFTSHKDVEVAALCDVDKKVLAAAAATVEKAGGKPDTFTDFRKLYERKGLDAVVIATPDHWHAIQTVEACEAGLDVYVEKPLSITVHEGRRMVEAARRCKRVVQVGLHRRSSALYADLAKLVAGGKIGKVTVARCYRLSNMHPAGIGKSPAAEPPAELDWDLWLGPRPMRPYQADIHPYKFRWWDLYSSQMANWGVHYLDVIRWATGDLAPCSVCAMGGKFAVDDDRTVPDTMEATFEFPTGRLAIFGQYEASGNPALPKGEVEFRGTQGTIYSSPTALQVVPERGGQFQDPQPRMKAEQITGGPGSGEKDLTALHARDFLDCLKTRKEPHADVEIGHRSTTMALLANISLATRTRLEWDPKNETITNNPDANKLLHYEYRAPWKLR